MKATWHYGFTGLRIYPSLPSFLPADPFTDPRIKSSAHMDSMYHKIWHQHTRGLLPRASMTRATPQVHLVQGLPHTVAVRWHCEALDEYVSILFARLSVRGAHEPWGDSLTSLV